MRVAGNPTKQQLREECIVNDRWEAPLIKVQSLAYIVLQRPDVEQAARFFSDFGLLIDERTDSAVYLRGVSTAHQMMVIEKGAADIPRIGLLAEEADLETLAARFALPICQHSEALGGRYVRLEDPDGLVIEVCSGLKSLSPLPAQPPLPQWNGAGDNKVRVNQMARNPLRPAWVYKLGHTVRSVASMQASLNWYQQTLGMIVSDFQFLPGDPLPVVAFMRCDCGDKPVDHHTIAIGTAPLLGHMHSAFELDNLEELLIGNRWLADQGYSHSWGIGRHVQGSQIFDYWREPKGEVFEHYVDGDVFSAAEATGYHLFNSEAQHQWGPEITADVTGQNRPLQTLRSIARRLFTQDDITVGRLKRLLKAVNS